MLQVLIICGMVAMSCVRMYVGLLGKAEMWGKKFKQCDKFLQGFLKNRVQICGTLGMFDDIYRIEFPSLCVCRWVGSADCLRFSGSLIIVDRFV